MSKTVGSHGVSIKQSVTRIRKPETWTELQELAQEQEIDNSPDII